MIEKMKRSEGIWAFLLSSLGMLLVCVFSMNQFPSGSTLVAGDTMEIYLPALRSLVRNLWSGQGSSYSFSLCLGMNAIGYYGIYAGGSLFNLLLFLLPKLSSEAVVFWFLIGKAGLAGGFFSLYSRKVLRVERGYALFFSVFYALCGFQVAINSMNYIWMDAVYLLPLLLLFVDRFVKEGKWVGMTLCYAYLFFSNFYMGYMVGFFTLFYFLLRVFLQKHPKRRILTFPLYVLLAAGLVAFLVVPSAYFLLTKNPPDATKQVVLSHNLLQLFSRFTFGVPFQSEVVLPYLYCGLPVVLLLPMYVTDKNIEGREKLVFLLLFALLMVSGMVPGLYLFWHGFDAPDGWYHRYGFLISFLCVAMGCREAQSLGQRERSAKQKFFLAVYLLALTFLLSMSSQIWYGESREKLLFWNLFLLLLWCVLFLMVAGKRGKEKKWLVGICFALALFEVVENGRLEHQIFQSKEEWEVYEIETESALALLKEDKDFYRIHYDNSLMINADTYFGYHGISDFGTYENYEVRSVLEKLGAYTSTRVMEGKGLNPFTQMLLNVKYVITGSGSMDKLQMGATVAPYERVLPLGFMVNEDITEYIFPGEDVLENTNTLASVMCGREITIFKELAEEDIEVVEEGITLGKAGDFYYLQGEPLSDGRMQILYQVENGGKPVYSVFYSHNKGIKLDRPQFFEVYSRRNYGYFGVQYTNAMEPFGEKLVCPIAMQQGVTRDYVTYRRAQFLELQEEGLEEFYREASKDPLEIYTFKEGTILGKVTVPKENAILFTSIPYDSGWKVTASKGEVEKIALLDGAFLGLRFPSKGEYNLQFTYEAPGLEIGIGISVTSFFILMGLLFWDKRTGKR